MTGLVGATGAPLQVPPLVSANNVTVAPPFTLNANSTATNKVSLAAGEILILPAGTWIVTPTGYAWVQEKDPLTRQWSMASQTSGVPQTVRSDGSNRRVVNMTGCPVGAFVTTVGSGYTNSTLGADGTLDTSLSPTVTINTGASKWSVIVGGAVSGTVTITTAGAGYVYAPTLIVSPPPPGGLPCTMTCTLSAGAINAVTVVNNGAGYQAAPTITVVPDPRETAVTTQAALTAATTGSGTVTGMVITNHGTPVTAVPTFTFSSGSAAATMVMAFTCTAITFSNAGVAYGNAQPYLCTIAGGIVAGSAGTTANPQISTRVFNPRAGFATGTSDSGGTLIVAPVIDDGGLFQRVPNVFITASGTAALPTTTAIAAATVGGTTDTVFIQASP